MVDFSKLLSHNALEAPPPPKFPEGVYKGIVKSVKTTTQKTKNGDAAVINVEAGLVDWPEEGIDEEVKSSIKLQGRSVTRGYFINTQEVEQGNLQSFFSLDQLIRSCGVAASGRAYSEVLPELVGADVSIRMKTRTYEDKSGKMQETTDVSALWGEHDTN